MSLIFGFHKEKHEHVEYARLDHQHDIVEQPGTVKTKTLTFTKYNNKNIIKVFNSGILLTGITTASASTTTPHTGLVYYDVHAPDGTTHVSSIRTRSGNYFLIQNSNNRAELLRLGAVYNIPEPCSIMIRLGKGSRLGESVNTDKSAVPPNPVKLTITLYYVEIDTVNFGGSDGGILAH